jgi:hypothetical protein
MIALFKKLFGKVEKVEKPKSREAYHRCLAVHLHFASNVGALNPNR